MTKLFENISKYTSLTKALSLELTNRTKIKTFKKGTIIHDANEICQHSYFIEKGILRLYFVKDEKEISEFFCSSGEWINSPRSFMQQKIDHYYIDIIEDCEVVILAVEDLVYLFENFPAMEKYARMDMGNSFGLLMERITSMRFTSAKEKYDHFCKTYTTTYHRIPLKMIASYLGITPETLSRIRKQA
ncbi:Crp/Fnr family transcriptional regulator [Tenacibaculum sp. S7007]|uniref:Crp/Fnr family transcriptional regulator n=1 Tax=Tenacibaculum pelagium TaxID=2759527 RepID=A0A839ATD7_9FLAO|nr:Crp/Fnr family transcriptional regulator [Tenacibaculum pelagium]MBA6157354.1 Crp/Fnr family transcriptional regulator [Tenacibaculum pelagium]